MILFCFAGAMILFIMNYIHPKKGTGQDFYLSLKNWVAIIAFGFCYSCHNENGIVAKEEPKIAKTVPLLFIRYTDSGFTGNRDTVFFNSEYFTGYRYALYPNGDTASLESFFNGVEEGFQRKWYPAKQPAEERFYINGKKEGVHKAWWPDGKPKFIFSVNGDAYQGEFREWYASGQISKEFHYVNGQEEGSEKMWWSNGAVRANYVIRGGKKYGLIGLTICSNPYDSVIKK